MPTDSDPYHVDESGIGPEDKVLRPAHEDAGVLRLLAAGMSRDAVENRVSSDRESAQAGNRRDLKSILAHAAALVRERVLMPSAEAAFLEKTGAAPSELGSLRSLSEQLLRAWISGLSDSGVRADPSQEHTHYTALRYAEALVRQEEVLEALGRVNSSNAPLQNRLTGLDRRLIDEYLLYRNTKGRFETLDSLTDLWERSVAWVEDRSDSYTYDEFVDRLTGRDSLEVALSLLSPTARETLRPRVGSLDERFVDATRAVSTSIRPYSPWRPQPWWWFRVPRQVSQSFQARLEAGGAP